ncbi:MAG: indolepyruvate oxidoreductase subunit beta [Candidatus Bipolaricaulia bacterium]
MMEKLRIFITGVGGQGSLTASRLLAEAALQAGQNVVVSEVHGMAQRGGVVETAVLIGEIHSPTIGGSEAQVILGFEPIETLRAMNKASRETLVITNTRPIVPITVSLGQSQYPEVEETLAQIEGFVGSGRLIALDATGLAKEAGSAIATNMVMVGALAATGRLPFSAAILKETISKLAPKYAAVNLKAFELGYGAVADHSNEPL